MCACILYESITSTKIAKKMKKANERTARPIRKRKPRG
jgi:hypothetical protein